MKWMDGGPLVSHLKIMITSIQTNLKAKQKRRLREIFLKVSSEEFEINILVGVRESAIVE